VVLPGLRHDQPDVVAAVPLHQAQRRPGGAEAHLDLGADRQEFDVAAEPVDEKRVALVPPVEADGVAQQTGRNADSDGSIAGQGPGRSK
jgi:hypothetical protein